MVNLWNFNLVEALGAVALLVGGIFTLWQWRLDHRWRRLETVFARIRSFDETPGTRNAQMILMAPRRPIPLWDPGEPPERRYVEVSWQDAREALEYRGRLPVRSDPMANAIRDSFDDFFNRMTQIEMYLEAGMLKKADVQHLVCTWSERLDGSLDDEGLTEAVWAYIQVKNRQGVVSLFNRFDCGFHRATPSTPAG